jgi:hypothetical protein
MADASAERELSYSEFDAEQRRKRASLAMQQGESKSAAASSTAATTKAPSPAAGKAQPSWRVRVLGGIVDSGVSEVAMLVVIVLDAIVSLLLLMHFDAGVAVPLPPTVVSAAVYEQGLLTSAQLLLTVAALESATALVAFGVSAFTHPGHLLDFAYVVLCVVAAATDSSSGLRLLGLLRLVWRVYRLHLGAVGQLETRLAAAEAALASSRLREQQQQLSLRRLEESAAEAAETRSHHEQVMANYRTQIENLREALEIAASHFVESTGMVDQVRCPGASVGVGGWCPVRSSRQAANLCVRACVCVCVWLCARSVVREPSNVWLSL